MSAPLNWSEVTADMKGLASLATVTPDGQPHVAIVSPTEVDGTIWIGINRSSAKARNLGAAPQAALVWSEEAELYLWGEAELVDDLDVKRSMWADAWSYDPAMFFQTPENEDYLLIKVTPTRAMRMVIGEQGPERRRWSR